MSVSEIDDWEAQLYERFPKMFTGEDIGLWVGKGWQPIVMALCANIQWHIDHSNTPVEQVVVTQIKEKFGGLRFYYDGGNQYISGLVSLAETWADHTCEMCGDKGTARRGGWIKTLCDHHEIERQAEYKRRFGEVNV